MRVLVIDDNQADADIIKENLNNYSVDISHCLQDGIKKISKLNYNAILLDLNLPDSEGINTIETMMDEINKMNKKVPVIVLTGMEDWKIGRQSMKLGAKDFLLKDDTNADNLERAISLATYDSNLPQTPWFSTKKSRKKAGS